MRAVYDNTYRQILCLFAAALYSSASWSISPSEINNINCERYISKLEFELRLDSLPSTQINHKKMVASCASKMNDNYRKGLPNFVTHMDRDVEIYLSNEFEKNAKKKKDADSEFLDKVIDKKCAESAVACSVLFVEKQNGLTRSNQIRNLRELSIKAKTKGIINAIAESSTYECLDEMYSNEYKWSEHKAREAIMMQYNSCVRKCREAMLIKW